MRKLTATVVVLGPRSSGRHSLIYRLCHNRLDNIPSESRNCGFMYFSHTHQISSETMPTEMTLEFYVKSSAHLQDDFSESKIHNAHAILLTFDATRPEESFAKAALEIAKRQDHPKKTPWFLVLTHCDSLSQEALAAILLQYKPIALSHQFQGILATSAITGVGMDALVERLTTSLFNQREVLKLPMSKQEVTAPYAKLWSSKKVKQNEATPLLIKQTMPDNLTPYCLPSGYF